MQIKICLFALSVLSTNLLAAPGGVAKKDADKQLRDSLEKRLQPNSEFRKQLYGDSLKRNLNRIDKEASGIRRESIKTILNVIKTTKDPRQKFELQRRLVDLYLEQGQYVEELEIRKFQSDSKKWEASKRKGKEPSLDYTKSRRIYDQAEAVLRVIIKDSMARKEVVYSLLDLGDLLDKKNDPEAPKFYKLVVSKHKDSPMLAEAYLSLGEYYFTKAKWEEARLWYQRLLKLREDRYYPYAAYKLGWVYYNYPAKDEADQKKIFQRSATAFKLVVKYASKAKKGTALYDMRESAINDLIMVWADAQDIKSAYEYFKKIGSIEKYYIVLERMAAAFVNQGKTKNAIQIFEKLLKEAPLRKNNPSIHYSLIEQYETLRSLKTMYKYMNEMIDTYVVSKSKWRVKNEDDEQAVKDGLDKTELALRYWATSYHKASGEQNRDIYIKFASMVYALYLKNFSSHPNGYEMRYYFADTLRSLKKPLASGRQFFQVVNLNRKDGKYLKISSEAAVDQFFLATKEKKFPAVPKRGTAKKPIEIPDEKKLLVTAIDSHDKLFPNEKDIPYMRFEAAEIYFVYGHYPEAIKRFTFITKTHPKEKQAIASVNIVLAYYSLNKDWLPLIDITKEYYKVTDLPAKLRDFIRETLIGASFKYAQLLESQKKYAEAAGKFVQFYRDFSKDKNASKALYNAVMNYRRAKDYTEYFKYGKLLFDAYPDFELVDELILSMAQTYEGIADYSNAARYYDLYSRKWPNKKTSLGAMYNASILYSGLKFYEQASKIVGFMSQMYPKAELTRQARTNLPNLFEDSGEFQKAASLYKDTLSTIGNKSSSEALDIRAKIMMLEAKSANQGVSVSALNSLAADLKRNKGGLEARKTVAKILFDRIEPSFKKYATMQIRGDQNLEKDAADKNKALAELVASYQKVIDIGHPEYLIASLIKMGNAHVEFGNALLVTPIEMSGNFAEIDEQFAPIRDAAMQLIRDGMDFYRAANKNAEELKYVSTWTNRSRELLASYFPLEYGHLEEPFLEFEFNHVR